MILLCFRQMLQADPTAPCAPPSSATGSGSDQHVNVAGATDSLLLARSGG